MMRTAALLGLLLVTRAAAAQDARPAAVPAAAAPAAASPVVASPAAFPLAAPPLAARPPAVMPLVRAGNWAAADAAAALSPDPVARKLVAFWRLLAPNAATAGEIAAFLADNPDWPLPGTLARRRDEAIASEPDDAMAASMCDRAQPAVTAPAGRLRCADAFGRLGRPADALAMLRLAWVEGPSDADWETRFMQRRAGAVGAEEQRRRFDRLAWTDAAGAKRQLARLDAADKPRAEAWLALKRDDASALALLGALPPATQNEPALFFEHAHWLRRAGQDDDAVALWRSAGAAAERAAPPERIGAFWDERNLLARRRLRRGDAATAYALVADAGPYHAEPLADAQFLAGFIALRRLGDPGLADRHFAQLGQGSKATITQARASYWRGRAAAARDDAGAAAEFFRAAAAYPGTYYGQLALVALGDADRLGARVEAARDPQPSPEQALGFAGRELARAAALTVSWGEPRRAAGFLLRLGDTSPDPADRVLAARLATGLGLADTAVWIARRAGRDGVALLQAGWPIAADVPPAAGVDPAFALGVIRQESSFDPAAASAAGARGLMQLMPATAAMTARQLGLPAVPALLADPAYNMRLGTAYLRRMLDQFDGSIPMAAAAYNAGPARVADWIAGFGDPRTAAVDAIDWIELIPINETRNYVQRVIENTVVYRAERGQADAHPLARWMR